MNIFTANPEKILVLGRQDENKTTTINFPIGRFVEKYGEGTFALVHRRPTDEQAYPCVTTRVNNNIVWEVKDSDLAYEGYGEVQLTLTLANGRTKSEIIKTYISRSLSATTTPPAPWQSWVDQVLQASEDAIEASESAEESAERAEEAAESIHGIPQGGTTGQVLKKKSATDYDMEWGDGGVAQVGWNDITDKPNTFPPSAHNHNDLYYTKTETDTALGDKVDKVTGKGLSTNDYTTEEKTKLSNLENYDDTAIKGRVSTIEGKESGWDAKYSKPNTGIPSTDMSSAVQTSLSKADSALQSVPNTYRTSADQDVIDNKKYEKPNTGIPATDLASSVQTSLGKADTALQEHQSLVNYSLVSETGKKIDLEIDNTNYKLTAKLYDKNNTLISTSSVIDLPIEQLVVSVTFDSATNELVITLKSGSVTRVPLGSIISGLATQTWVQSNYATQTSVATAIADAHEHSNKELLDTYTQTETDIADAVTKKHTHSNMSVLEGISSADVEGWDAKYAKPSGGIPSTDMSSAVQTSLGKADTALQEHQSLNGYATETWVGQQGFLTEHQSLSAYRTSSAQDVIDNGKQATISDLDTIRSGAALGATALQSVPNTYRTSADQDTIDSTKVDKLTTSGTKVYSHTGSTQGEMSVDNASSIPLVTSVSPTAPSDSKVPTEKAVRDYVGGNFELIETITLTEAVASISRTQTTGGTPYNFKKVLIKVVTPAVSGSTDKSNIIFHANGLYAMYATNGIDNTKTLWSYVKVFVDSGFLQSLGMPSVAGSNSLFNYYGVNGLLTTQAESITNLTISSTVSGVNFPVGTTVDIYGVWA